MGLWMSQDRGREFPREEAQMREHGTGHRRILSAIALAGIAAGVAHAEERVEQSVAAEAAAVEVVETEETISERAYEWVDISIHMPDGRVIHTKERRYPSRSRVYQLTGKLPMVKRGAGGPSGGPGSAGGEDLMTVLVADETGTVAGSETGSDSAAGVGAGLLDGSIDGAGIVESLVDAFVDAGGEPMDAEPVVIADPSAESVVVDQDNGRSVRVFKKSS